MNPTIDEVLKVKKEVQLELLALAGVQGVGIGYKVVDEKKTQEPSIVFLVEEKIADIGGKLALPSSVNGVKTDVVVHQVKKNFQQPAFEDNDDSAAPQYPYDPRYYFPLQGGSRIFSAGNANKAGGTLGMLLQGPNGPALLSNAHVLGTPGSEVCHPDPGNEPIADVLAGSYGDSAIAALRSNVSFRNWIIEVGLVQGTYAIPDTALDFKMKKRGCYTGLTHCDNSILDVVRLDADGKLGVPTFLVYGKQGTFNTGDSGSVLVDDYNRVCGLLYYLISPKSDVAEAIPIEPVLSALGCSLLKEGNGRLFGVYKGTNAEDWAYSRDTNVTSLLSEPTLLGTNDDIPPSFLAAPPVVVNYRNLNGTDTYHPAVVTQSLYSLFNIKPNNKIGCSTFDGRAWSLLDNFAMPGLDIKNGVSPAAVEYRSNLYIVRSNSNGYLQCAVYNGNSIVEDYQISPQIEPVYEPGLVVADGLLYCFYSPKNDPLKIRFVLFDADTDIWTDFPLTVTSGATAANAYSGCAAATFHGKMYCARQGPEKQIYFNVRNGDLWTDDQCIPGFNYPMAVSALRMFVYIDTLFIAYENVNGPEVEWLYTEDGIRWDLTNYSPWLASGPVDAAIFPGNKVDIAATGGYQDSENNLYAITAPTQHGDFAKLWNVNIPAGGAWQQFPTKPPANMIMLTAGSNPNSHLTAIDKPNSTWSIALTQGAAWVKNSPQINNFVRDLAGSTRGWVSTVTPFGQKYLYSLTNETPGAPLAADSSLASCAVPAEALNTPFFYVDGDGNFQSNGLIEPFPYSNAKAIALLNSTPNHPAYIVVACSDNMVYSSVWDRNGIWFSLTNNPARFSIVKIAVTTTHVFALDAFGNIFFIPRASNQKWSRYTPLPVP